MRMVERTWTSLIVMVGLLIPLGAEAGVRVKDMAAVSGVREESLIGYGLVVGLDRTGDSRGALFTVQSVTNMLARFGIMVPPEKVRLKNVAAVIVTARVPAFVRKGSRVDVVVSSMGDAKSLEGGTLLLTPLTRGDGDVVAYAQGPVSIGGFNVEGEGGERIRKNYTLVGRVPGGAVMEQDKGFEVVRGDTVTLTLRRPDFTSAARLAKAVDERFGEHIAVPVDAGTVLVALPEAYRDPEQWVAFVAEVEGVEVTPDGVARVVINERTGTIVVGENVALSTVAVSHGNLTIRIRSTPVISQPAPFSQGQTVVTPQTEASVEEGGQQVILMEATSNVGDLARALNALGVSPRDMIAIFQALKQAGALQGELVII